MATLPVPGSASAGAVAPSATANTWRDAAQWLLGSTVTTTGQKRPLAVLRQTVLQSIPNNTGTDLTFDTEDLDTDGGHTGSSATYTFLTAGTYLLIGTAQFVAGTGDRQSFFRATLNSVVHAFGAAHLLGNSTASAETALTNVAILPGVLVNDTLTYRVIQVSGGALNTATTNDGSRLQILWIGN